MEIKKVVNELILKFKIFVVYCWNYYNIGRKGRFC